MRKLTWFVVVASAAFVSVVGLDVGALAQQRNARVERKTCTAPDGVRIVYSTAGAGEPALVFVHGALANRTFFDSQIQAFAPRYRVIALDLAGHGESGANRKAWTMQAFGADIKAVVDAEHLKRVILFGNSMGGPCAMEAALLLPGRAIGVVGIDTFQDLAHPETPEYSRQAAAYMTERRDALRKDYAGGVKAMIAMLFHKDADPAVVADAERRMMKTSPETGNAIMSALIGYDSVPIARRLTVPLRAINGDLYPTDIAAIRNVKPDFDAIVMKHMGHYPMLERPDEFNQHVATVVVALDKR